MHAVAFGKIGLRPREYYCMTSHEYQATVAGYNLRAALEENNYRKMAAVMAQAFGAKNKRLKPKDIWPIPFLDDIQPKENKGTAADGKYFERMIKMYGGNKSISAKTKSK